MIGEAAMQEPMQVYMARHRFARISPRKVRPVAGLIRGRRCNDAMEQLQFNARRGAAFVREVLRSAMANADEQEADMGRLFVKEIQIDGGPYYRRWRPKDRGRAHPIAKRTSHITIKLAEA
jgi:large subunit ribosomal protein L22